MLQDALPLVGIEVGPAQFGQSLFGAGFIQSAQKSRDTIEHPALVIDDLAFARFKTNGSARSRIRGDADVIGGRGRGDTLAGRQRLAGREARAGNAPGAKTSRSESGYGPLASAGRELWKKESHRIILPSRTLAIAADFRFDSCAGACYTLDANTGRRLAMKRSLLVVVLVLLAGVVGYCWAAAKPDEPVVVTRQMLADIICLAGQTPTLDFAYHEGTLAVSFAAAAATVDAGGDPRKVEALSQAKSRARARAETAATRTLELIRQYVDPNCKLALAAF